MCRIKLLFCLFLSFSFFFIASAQEEKKPISLRLLLDQISAQHHIRFNYAEDEIVVYNLVPPDKDWTLNAKIQYIESMTKLHFKVIGNKYYTIYNDKKMDKPLCGFLTNAESDFPISDAVVSIATLNISVSSDANGYFELPVISAQPIQIRHLNYLPVDIDPATLYAADCIHISMVSDAQPIAEVVTERYLTSGISKTADGTIQVKPHKFGILPGLAEPDVLQAMQQIPGISSVDETNSNINVRGGTHDQNLFLWNGVRMFQTSHFFGLISAFNPSLAHTIAITKNGTSAFFGESVSSVIEMSAQGAGSENSNYSAGINLISADFYARLRTSAKSSVEISGRRSLNDLVETPAYTAYRDRIFQNTVVTDLSSSERQNYKLDEDFYFYDFSIQYRQQIGRRSALSVNGIGIQNELALNQESAVSNVQSALGQKNFGGAIAWKTAWNARNITEAICDISYYNLSATNRSVATGQILSQQNIVRNLGAHIKNTWLASENLNFAYGYQFDEIDVTNFDEVNTPFFSRNIRNTLYTHAFVGEASYESANKKTFAKAGLRGNYFQKFNKSLAEPRIQFGQALTEHWRFEIMGERKSQALTQIIDLQQDFLGIEKRRWVLADGALVPILKSGQISVGLTYKDRRWLISADNFYKKVTGLSSGSQGFQNQFEFVKIAGAYRVWGTEILLQRNFGRFYSWASYSFNDNKYDFRKFYAAPFPNNFELKHSVSCAGIYEWKKVKIALGSKWHSGKPVTLPISNVSENPAVAYNVPNSSNLRNFFQLNFSLAKSWKWSGRVKMETTASVLNLLNRRNIVNGFYRVGGPDNAVEKVDIYSLKRTPNINIKVVF